MRTFNRIGMAFLAVVSLTACGIRATREARPLPSFSKTVADDIVFEIDARIELLAGVQSMTSWVSGARGPVTRNAYFEELKSAFAPFSSGAAVRKSEALAKRGFTYDAPPAMAVSLDGGEAFDAPTEGWSEYLKGRAGGASALERMRTSLADAYDAAGFRSFLEAHAAVYRRWIDAASDGFDAKSVSAWLEKFFGFAARPVYHFVFAPAMFPGGGYGLKREISEGGTKRLHLYQIVRAQGSSDGDPGFPSGKALAALALHEFGHSFIKTALEKAPIAQSLVRIYNPVEKKMRNMSYGTPSSFYNELLVRAAAILGARDLGLTSANGVEGKIRTEELSGFYPIRRVIALFEEYSAGRGEHRDFDSFAPVLLGRLAERSEEIVAEGASMRLAGWDDGKAPATTSFKENFDGMVDGELPRGFAVGAGSYLMGAEGGQSRISIDRAAAAGGAALRLDADASTSCFLILRRPIAVKSGELTARFNAGGECIRKESFQYGGSYVGFILTDSSGKASFVVRPLSGSFGRETFKLEATVDPRRIAEIDFAILLNESGTLWVDDIEVGYR
jgi:hypothetical protein